jgi:exodeoxyribonuclease V alpha subunit
VALWTSDLPWAPHEEALAQWSAARWGWKPGDPDWPSAVALLAFAEDEGHTAVDWALAPQLWSRRFARLDSPPAFSLPPPETWPPELFDGWLVRAPQGQRGLQTARNAALEATLRQRLAGLAASTPAGLDAVGQDAAVARAGRVRLLLLAGGPGTGKTTTLRKLVTRWTAERPGLRTVVAAPTGRAAVRVRQSFAGADAVPECLTVHRLLGLPPGLGAPWHGPHRPLPFDLVIVDEASMLDLRTAVALTAALGPQAALVLVGDPGQLPSVEAGAVFRDVLALPELSSAAVRLHERFRLAETSRTLVEVFDLLQDPSVPADEAVEKLARWGAGQAPDFRWLVCADDEDPGPRALASWGSPRNLTGAALSQSILLSPVHEGPGGAQTLGGLIDRSLGRHPGAVGPSLPWIITRNLPHLDLSNGDRGLVAARDGQLWFEDPEVPGRSWPFSLVREDGQSAWAITVHKSQGSEYDCVVLVLPPTRLGVSGRELVYTALTRARSSAVLVSSEASLRAALTDTGGRQTGFSLQ